MKTIFYVSLAALTLSASPTRSAEYFVAQSGSDAANGSAAAPWKTLQKAADTMVKGDVCRVRAGVYRETVRPRHSGAAGQSITFQAFGDGAVVVSGTEVVRGWQLYKDGIYRAAVAQLVDEVFVNGQAMMLACHPNQPISPQGGFARLQWKRGTANPPAEVDYSDAVALRPAMSWRIEKIKAWEDNPQGVLMGALGLLDAEGEWFYKNGTLYLKPPGGKNPQELLVESKARVYGFDLSGRSYITVSGITVFGASLNLDNADNCLIEKSKVFYPCPLFIASKTWRDENSLQTWGKGVVLGGHHNTLRACEIAHSWGDGVTLYGADNTIEECHIYDCDWSGTDAALIGMSGGGHFITRNTLHDCGRTGIVARRATAKSVVSYNDVYNYGWLTYDLGGIYIGWRQDSKGLEVAYNWFHDSRVAATSGNSGPGIYSDGNYNAVWHHNVVWNVGGLGLQVNPNDFVLAPDGTWKPNPQPFADMQLYNNTCFAGGMGGGFAGGRNLKSYNNLVYGRVLGDDQQNNLVIIEQEPFFSDPYQGDFRLRPASPALNAGKTIPGFTDGFVGNAPDIGAYEAGATPWVPGAAMAQKTALPPVPAQPRPRPAQPLGTLNIGRPDRFSGVNLSSGLYACDGGDWVQYGQVDFGAGVASCTLQVGVADKYAGGQVELRLDSKTGPLIGTLTVAGTGGFAQYTPQTVPLTRTTGVHDLYLVFKGQSGVGNFAGFTFK